MNHDTSYMNTNYGRDKMIESYNREEKEKIKQEEKGATSRAGIMLPPAPEKEDDRQNN